MVKSRTIPHEEMLTKIRVEYSTKSAQIRALAKDGWSHIEIADALGIRYQHVWNVLARDKENRIKIAEALLKQQREKNTPAPQDQDNAVDNATRLTGLFGLGKSHLESGKASASACNFQEIDDALTNAKRAPKQPVNLSINSGLLETAKRLNINLSETLEGSLVTLLKREAMARWQNESREAIEASNQFVERHGLWSDGLRLF